MPNYEYKCPVCGGVEERQRPIAERDNVAICRECPGINAMDRLAAAPGFALVGAGFYQNDYKRKELYAEKPK
jgi:putative FmdB family regulatory protein